MVIKTKKLSLDIYTPSKLYALIMKIFIGAANFMANACVATEACLSGRQADSPFLSTFSLREGHFFCLHFKTRGFSHI